MFKIKVTLKFKISIKYTDVWLNKLVFLGEWQMRYDSFYISLDFIG